MILAEIWLTRGVLADLAEENFGRRRIWPKKFWPKANLAEENLAEGESNSPNLIRNHAHLPVHCQLLLLGVIHEKTPFLSS
jgi:hypothetical protein